MSLEGAVARDLVSAVGCCLDRLISLLRALDSREGNGEIRKINWTVDE